MRFAKLIVATIPALFVTSQTMAFTVVNTTDSDLKITISATKKHSQNPNDLSVIKLGKNSSQTNLGGFTLDELKTQAAKGGPKELYDVSVKGAEVGTDQYGTCQITDPDTTITFKLQKDAQGKNTLTCEATSKK